MSSTIDLSEYRIHRQVPPPPSITSPEPPRRFLMHLDPDGLPSVVQELEFSDRGMWWAATLFNGERVCVMAEHATPNLSFMEPYPKTEEYMDACDYISRRYFPRATPRYSR